VVRVVLDKIEAEAVQTHLALALFRLEAERVERTHHRSKMVLAGVLEEVRHIVTLEVLALPMKDLQEEMVVLGLIILLAEEEAEQELQERMEHQQSLETVATDLLTFYEMELLKLVQVVVEAEHLTEELLALAERAEAELVQQATQHLEQEQQTLAVVEVREVLLYHQPFLPMEQRAALASSSSVTKPTQQHLSTPQQQVVQH
jgi:hypothetical protein